MPKLTEPTMTTFFVVKSSTKTDHNGKFLPIVHIRYDDGQKEVGTSLIGSPRELEDDAAYEAQCMVSTWFNMAFFSLAQTHELEETNND